MVLFENITEIPEASEIIDLAFRRARKAADKKISGPPIKKAKKREKKRIRVSSQVMRNRLKKILNGFPNPEKLHSFYFKILNTLSNGERVSKSLESFKKSTNIIKNIEREKINEINKSNDPKKISEIRRECYGRFSSVINKLKPTLIFLKETKNKIKNLPYINPKKAVIIVTGYPNVGKSTLIKNLTHANPKVASFPFTTRKIILGHLKIGWRKYQIMDTPGLLDRKIEERSLPEKQVIHALTELNPLIIYLFDPTEYCGFTKTQQIKLFKELLSNFSSLEFLPLLNKIDIVKKKNEIKINDLEGEIKTLGFVPYSYSAKYGDTDDIKNLIDDYFINP